MITCIIEHLVLHNDLVAVQGLWVHLIVRILVGKIEQNLVKIEIFISELIKDIVIYYISKSY